MSPHPWQGHVGEFWWARRARTRGVPLWACLSIYPKSWACLFYCFMTFTNSSDSHEGLSPTTLTCKKSNLELELISLQGIIRCVPIVFPSESLLTCLTGFRTPTAMPVIVCSLPTMWSTRRLSYPNNAEPLGELEIVKNRTNRRFLCWVNAYCQVSKFLTHCVPGSVLINIVDI